MNLEKAPPSRYRIEEKDGRLIVHDNLSSTVLGNQFGIQPQTRSSLASDTSRTETTADSPARARSALDTISAALPAARPREVIGESQDRAKRGAIVAIATILIGLLLIFTSLWPVFILIAVVPALRQAFINRLVPAIQLYIAEGRFR